MTPSTTTSLEPALAQALSAISEAITALTRVLGGSRQPVAGATLTSSPAPASASAMASAPLAAGANGGVTAAAPASGAASTPAPAPAGGRSTARVATFNVLGASHTDAGGNKPGWATGVQRVPEMIQELRSGGVEIAGLQEFQPSQQQAFKAAKTGYELHGERDNVIAWRSDRYRKVGATSLTIPYFEGSPRKMPAVQLEDRATGKRVWVLNVHNPADTKAHPRNVANRREAERRERAFVEQLKQSGVPVLVVGDFNDNRESIDAMTAGGLTSVARPRQNASGIDWVFGSQGVNFANTTRDFGPRQDRTSDHPIVTTTATF